MKVVNKMRLMGQRIEIFIKKWINILKLTINMINKLIGSLKKFLSL